MKLKARFEAKSMATPGRSDAQPLGTGPTNRHGMPQLPPGQHVAKAWPVLDLGRRPVVSTEEWTLELQGAVDHARVLNWEEFTALPQVEDTSDFHCVTTWSKFDIPWRGVRFAELAALAGVHEDAAHLFVHGYDGYTTNLPLVEAMKDDVLIATHALGEPLAIEHGGPARMITPQLYAWKGAKWISCIEFRVEDELGYWERRGYSNSAHPWRDDRYS